MPALPHRSHQRVLRAPRASTVSRYRTLKSPCRNALVNSFLNRQEKQQELIRLDQSRRRFETRSPTSKAGHAVSGCCLMEAVAPTRLSRACGCDCGDAPAHRSAAAARARSHAASRRCRRPCDRGEAAACCDRDRRSPRSAWPGREGPSGRISVGLFPRDGRRGRASRSRAQPRDLDRSLPP